MTLTASLPSLATLSPIERTAHIRQMFEQDRKQMTLMLARQLNVSEVEIMRSLPPEMAEELDSTQWEAIIRAFESLESVHVIVSNGAATIECVGEFGHFSLVHGFFNVQSPMLDMHIRARELAAVFAIRKPSHVDGHETLSIQFFDSLGHAAFKVFLTFGGKSPSAKRQAQFAELIERFRKK